MRTAGGRAWGRTAATLAGMRPRPRCRLRSPSRQKSQATYVSGDAGDREVDRALASSGLAPLHKDWGLVGAVGDSSTPGNRSIGHEQVDRAFHPQKPLRRHTNEPREPCEHVFEERFVHVKPVERLV